MDEDEDVAALAQHLQQLPKLIRLYLKEEQAYYGTGRAKPSSTRPRAWVTVHLYHLKRWTGVVLWWSACWQRLSGVCPCRVVHPDQVMTFPQASNGGAGIPEKYLQHGRRALHVLDLRVHVELLMELQERIAAGEISVALDTRRGSVFRTQGRHFLV